MSIFLASVASRTFVSLARISFSNPIMSCIEPMVVPVSGSIIVSVFGSLIGGHEVSPITNFGTSSAPSSIWQSDSAVIAKALSGTGRFHAVRVSVSQYYGSISEVLSYTAPRPQRSLHASAASTGNSLVVVVGDGFGAFEMSPGFRISGTSTSR
jgi:hypothetical protein